MALRDIEIKLRDAEIARLRAELERERSGYLLEHETAEALRAERDAARDSAKEWERIAESQLVRLRTMRDALEEIAQNYPTDVIWLRKIAHAALSRLSAPGAQQRAGEDGE